MLVSNRRVSIPRFCWYAFGNYLDTELVRVAPAPLSLSLSFSFSRSLYMGSFEIQMIAGHYQDAIPSLDHYGFMRTGINYMLLSTLDDEQGSVLVFPAWPSVRTSGPALIRSHAWELTLALLFAEQVECTVQAACTAQYYNRGKLSRRQARISRCDPFQPQGGCNCAQLRRVDRVKQLRILNNDHSCIELPEPLSPQHVCTYTPARPAVNAADACVQS